MCVWIFGCWSEPSTVVFFPNSRIQKSGKVGFSRGGFQNFEWKYSICTGKWAIFVWIIFFTLYFIDYRCLTPKIMTPQIHTNRTDTCLFYWIEETCHRNQVLPPLPPQVILRVRNIQSQKTIYTIYTIYTFLLKCQNMEKHRVLSTNILKIHQRYGWNRFSRIPEFIYHNLGQFSRILAFSRIPDARRVPVAAVML